MVGSCGAAMAAGIHARRAGRSVVLVERALIGGTCVNIGCVPSKTLLGASGQREHALHNPFRGVPTSAGPVDLAAVVEQKDALIEGMRAEKYVDGAAAHGFDIRRGEDRFADPDMLMVDERPLPASAYVLATGLAPAIPNLPGIADVDPLTSRDSAAAGSVSRIRRSSPGRMSRIQVPACGRGRPPARR